MEVGNDAVEDSLMDVGRAITFMAAHPMKNVAKLTTNDWLYRYNFQGVLERFDNKDGTWLIAGGLPVGRYEREAL